MSNLKNKLYWLGEGLRVTSNPEPIIYWGNNSVKVLKLTDGILQVELKLNGDKLIRTLPISHEDYTYLTNCLSKFNLN